MASSPSVRLLTCCWILFRNQPTVFIKCKIQSSAEPRMKPLSCPSQFILCNKGQSRTISSRKRHPIKCSILVFQRHFAAAATIYQEPHFSKRLSTEPQEPFAFLLDQKIVFHVECTIYKKFNSWILWVI